MRQCCGDGQPPTIVEDFVLRCGRVPDLCRQLEVWKFRLDFAERCRAAGARMRALANAAEALQTSRAFTEVRDMARELLNRRDLRIADLPQAMRTRADNGVVTLVEYLAVQIGDSFPHRAAFVPEVSATYHIGDTGWHETSALVDGVVTMQQEAPAEGGLKEVVQSQAAKLQEEFQGLQAKVRDLCLRFGEHVEQDAAQMFSAVAQFAQQFEVAYGDRQQISNRMKQWQQQQGQQPQPQPQPESQAQAQAQARPQPRPPVQAQA